MTLLRKQKNNKKKFEKVKTFNISGEELPKDIVESLELGTNHAVGGRPKKLKLLSDSDGLFEFWKKYALTQNLKHLTIFEMQAEVQPLNYETCMQILKMKNRKNDKVFQKIR